ncbi:MAG: glycerol-3-phosphate dehydrogenase, partial [Lachnospira sp.]|nr:glycerol-3-phosphate dehydrogenase [Lachnospira sp.]
MAKISIMGAGSWGLGLSILLNNNGHEVTVWSVFEEELDVLRKN